MTDPILCPACRDPGRHVTRSAPTFPFCSQRCRDQDLAAWVEERYRVRGERADLEGRSDDAVSVDPD